MKSWYDISLIKWDWYLILPISMSRISNSQSHEKCYEMIDFFTNKLEEFGNDVIFLYTNWLYFNSNILTFEDRKKSNQQILNHRVALGKLISKNKKYIPKAFHFLPIDYVILNSKYYTEFFSKLKKQEEFDNEFRNAILQDIWNREYNEANVNFILEEVAVSHILRQKLVELPRTLVRNDMWRLIVYPWTYLKSDLYQWTNSILPKDEQINQFAWAHYDYSNKQIFLYDEFNS